MGLSLAEREANARPPALPPLQAKAFEQKDQELYLQLRSQRGVRMRVRVRVCVTHYPNLCSQVLPPALTSAPNP